MQILALPALAASIGLIALIFYLAIAVQHDAAIRSLTKRGVFLVGHWGWFFIVLFTGGFLGAFVYWLIHYSALRYAPRHDE
jgi:hypothetical protein